MLRRERKNLNNFFLLRLVVRLVSVYLSDDDSDEIRRKEAEYFAGLTWH